MEGNGGNATLSAVVVLLGCDILSYRLGSVLHSYWGSLGLLSLLCVKVQVQIQGACLAASPTERSSNGFLLQIMWSERLVTPSGVT